MRASRAIAVGLAAMLAASVAQAQAQPGEQDEAGDPYSRNGPYIGVGGTYAFPQFHRVKAGVPRDSFDDSLGINGRIAYRIAPALAFEAQVEWIDSFDGKTSKAENIVLPTLNVKVPLPIGRFQPYGLVGLGIMFWDKKIDGSSGSSNEGAMRLGGGIDIYATEHFVLSVGAEYVFLFEDSDKIDYVSTGWGLQYRF